MVLRWLLSGRFFLLLIFAAGAYWNFQTGHTVAGTVTFAVVLAVGIIWLQQPPDFTPFRVHIRPLRPLLFEFKLATEAQLNAANEVRERKGSDAAEEDADLGDSYATPGHSVLRQGVRFTMLKPPFSGSGLVFWDDSNSFSTDIDQFFWFSELRRPSVHPGAPSYAKDCPGLHLEWTDEGLVISVIDSADRGEYSYEYNKRRAALIPWQEFGIVGRPPKRRDALMVKNGWRREEHVYGRLEDLRHKYFEVYWNFI